MSGCAQARSDNAISTTSCTAKWQGPLGRIGVINIAAGWVSESTGSSPDPSPLLMHGGQRCLLPGGQHAAPGEADAAPGEGAAAAMASSMNDTDHAAPGAARSPATSRRLVMVPVARYRERCLSHDFIYLFI